MQALELQSYDMASGSLVLVDKPVPEPGRGEVLVRMHYAPLNPADLMFMRGLYGHRRKLPTVPGFEGCGVVVEAGSGWLPRFLKGRRIACSTAGPNVRNGTWAEYCVTSASLCVPLLNRTDFEQGAMMLANPLTAWALIEEARRRQHTAIIQTAASGAIGGMIRRLARRFGIAIVNIVRSADSAARLQTDGEIHVLNSAEPGFERKLRILSSDIGATLAFDAVAGDMTRRLVRAMPRGSRILVYGSLSMQTAQIDPVALIFEQKSVHGFWTGDWLQRRGWIDQLLVSRRIQQFLDSCLRSEVRARMPLEEGSRAIDAYTSNMSAGKVLLSPLLRNNGRVPNDVCNSSLASSALDHDVTSSLT